MVELHADQAAVFGAMLDHVSAHHEKRRILVIVDEDGLRLQVGDHPATAALGKRVAQ
jgi:hypothetical protein